MVLAFSGKIGSGKTSISKAVAAYLKWPRVSFGDYVRLIANQRQLSHERKDLQRLGEELLSTDIDSFCQAVLAQADRPEGNLIIDGVRHELVIKVLRGLVRPSLLIHVHIPVDLETQRSRLNDIIVEDLLHSTEYEATSTLASIADSILYNTGSIDQAVLYIVDMLSNFDND